MIAYNLVTSFIAIIFLFALAGFQIHINWPTILYAVVYAAVCASSMFNILAMKWVGVSLSGICGSSGNIICTVLFGILFLSEPFNLSTLLSAGLMLVAIILPMRHFSKDTSQKSAFWLCIVLFLIGGSNAIVCKLFAISPHVTDSNSFFVLTNVVIFVICAISWLAIPKKYVESKNLLKIYSLKEVGGMMGCTALSNLSSLISVAILAQMDISLYSVLNASLTVIIGIILSKLFKEKLTKDNYIACGLAIAAAIIRVWDQLVLLVVG